MMTNKIWRGATALGSAKVGDLVAALNRVTSARSPRADSPLSGSMLYFTADQVLVWAGEGARLAMIPVVLSQPGAAEGWFAAVPNGFVSALREHFERSDIIELGGTADGSVIVRRGSEDARTLVQPLWAAQSHIDAYNAFLIESDAVGTLRMRGEDLRAALAHADGFGVLTLDVKRETLTVNTAEGASGTAVSISSSLAPCQIHCDRALLADAVNTVVDVKFPNLVVEVHSAQGILKLYGGSRREPQVFGALDYLISTRPQPDHDGKSVPSPASAWIEEPKAAGPIEEALAELDAIVGQEALKREVRGLVHQVEINRLREAQGLKLSRIGSHLVFTGPPGTGKTTVARLVARLYHALGVLENAEVKEVASPDLTSPNIGGTEEKTAAVVADALGGVLFIDEAYTLSQGGDNSSGKPAIDVLVKELEDKRSQFVCIIAGYTQQMKEFMASNPGLASRFRPPIAFAKYSVEELARIADDMAAGMDNRIADDARLALVHRLQDEERRGGFDSADWGNARSIRNIVEGAVTHRDMRISLSGAHDYDSLVNLTVADIEKAVDDLGIGRAAGREESVEEVMAELDAQVGQPALKRQIRAILAQARVQQAKQSRGDLKTGFALEHLLFVGPPGTGKTTIARLVARLYRALGLLPKDEIVEVDRTRLVGQYIGQTALETAKRIDEAMGGVLFIDEAYALVTGGQNDYGPEAINTLLPRLENDRGKFVAIAAGYPEPMAKFLDANVGLKSRFTTTVEFMQYTADELVQIAESMAIGRKESLTLDARTILLERLTAAEKTGVFSSEDWGNARSVRNLLDRAVQQRDLRLGGGDGVFSVDDDSLFVIEAIDVSTACDIEKIAATQAEESVEDVLAELDAQIGQPQLKLKVREILAQVRFDVERREAGLVAGPVPLEHLLFVGPPGTGKTTIARLVARLYRALGLLPKDEIVEVDRTRLVGQYIGQTALETAKRIDEAMGGVLFIDEAYALVTGGQNDYGPEAINTLLPRLENDRGKFVAIAAGYPEPMAKFLDANVGLKSRFTERIEFVAYTVDELAGIAQGMARKAGQHFDGSAQAAFLERFGSAEQAGQFTAKDWGNARQARVVVEGAMKARDLRLSVDGLTVPTQLITLTAADVHASCDRYSVGTHV